LSGVMADATTTVASLGTGAANTIKAARQITLLICIFSSLSPSKDSTYGACKDADIN
jgi:hypothetical protein